MADLCPAELAELLACAEGKTFSCQAESPFPAGCESQHTALKTCYDISPWS